MANIKSALKNIRKNATRYEHNRGIKSRIKTLQKSLQVAAEGEDAEATKAAAVSYVSAVDKAAKTKIISKKSADRQKSACAKYIFA